MVVLEVATRLPLVEGAFELGGLADIELVTQPSDRFLEHGMAFSVVGHVFE